MHPLGDLEARLEYFEHPFFLLVYVPGLIWHNGAKCINKVKVRCPVPLRQVSDGHQKKNFTTKLPRTTLGTGLARTGTKEESKMLNKVNLKLREKRMRRKPSPPCGASWAVSEW